MKQDYSMLRINQYSYRHLDIKDTANKAELRNRESQKIAKYYCLIVHQIIIN